MTLESRGTFLGSTMIAVACLVGAASAAQNPQGNPPMAGESSRTSCCSGHPG